VGEGGDEAVQVVQVVQGVGTVLAEAHGLLCDQPGPPHRTRPGHHPRPQPGQAVAQLEGGRDLVGPRGGRDPEGRGELDDRGLADQGTPGSSEAEAVLAVPGEPHHVVLVGDLVDHTPGQDCLEGSDLSSRTDRFGVLQRRQ